MSECASCEHVRPLYYRGLCRPCRDSHRATRTIGQFGYIKADRLTDYAWLTRGCGESLSVAAARIGVSERTAWRYEAELRLLAPSPSPAGTEGLAA